MTAPRKVNVDRMRRHNARFLPKTAPEPVEPEYPEGSTPVFDAVGRLIRVLPPPRGNVR